MQTLKVNKYSSVRSVKIKAVEDFLMLLGDMQKRSIIEKMQVKKEMDELIDNLSNLKGVNNAVPLTYLDEADKAYILEFLQSVNKIILDSPIQFVMKTDELYLKMEDLLKKFRSM